MPKPDDTIVPLNCNICGTQCGQVTFFAVPDEVDDDNNVLSWTIPVVDPEAIAAAYTSRCDIHS